MNPWLIAVPVVGGAMLWLLWPKGAASPYAPPAPPPGTPPATMPGGARALSYMQRLDAALLAYRAVKLIGGAAAANAMGELRVTLDVVPGMAEQDLLQRRITQLDMNTINTKVATIRREIGG